MERETKTLTTTGAHVIIYYTYATGREARAIEQKVMGALDVSMGVDNKPVLNKFDTSASFEAEKEAIRFLVKSIDGVTENVVDKALDLPQSEYEEIVVAINEVTNGKKKK